MNIYDSKAMMDKLSSLLSAAEEFKNQSEQLAAARGDFDSYLVSVKKTDEMMVKVIKKCEEYIDSARELVGQDLTAQIKEIVESTEASVAACKTQCEQVTADYKEVVALFEQQKPSFEEQQKRMVEAVEKGFERETASRKEALAGLEEKTASLVQNLSESIENVKSMAFSVIADASDKSLAEIKTVGEESSTIRAIVTDLGTEIATAKEWQKRNELLIIIGVAAACLAALASVIGLFV